MSLDKHLRDFEETLSIEAFIIKAPQYKVSAICFTFIALTALSWYVLSEWIDAKWFQLPLGLFACLLIFIPFWILANELLLNRNLLPRTIRLKDGLLYSFSGGTRTYFGDINDLPVFYGSSMYDNLIGLRMWPRKCVIVKVGFFRYLAVGLTEEHFRFWSEIIEDRN